MKILIKILSFIKYLIPILVVMLTSSIINLKNKNLLIQTNKINERKFLAANILISNQFSEEEIVIMSNSVYDWNNRTKGVISFTIVREPFKNMDFNNSVLVIKASDLDPDVIIMDTISNCQSNSGCTLGLTSSEDFPVSNIKIVSDRMKNNDQLYTTFLHELGHYIGLEHQDDIQSIGTVMFPITGEFRKELTRRDLKYFCDVYHCDDNKRNEILNDNSNYTIPLPLINEFN